MAVERGKKRFVYAASMVGFAMVILVACTQLMGLLGGLVVRATAADVRVGAELEAVEWILGAYNLVAVLVSFAVPTLFLLKTGRRLGLKVELWAGSVPLGVLLALFLGVMIALNSTSNLLRALVGAIFSLPPAAAATLPGSVLGRVFYFLASCLATPVMEELFFRGTVQKTLRAWGPRFSIVITSLLFTLMHASVWELPTIFLLSLLLGYIGEVSGSVVPCMVLHAANNSFVFLVRLAQQRLETMTAIALVLWLVLAFVLAFAGAIWAVRQLRLGPRLALRRDPARLGGRGKRLLMLAKTPVFTFGLVVVVAHFVLRILGLSG